MPYRSMTLDVRDGIARLTFTEAARGNLEIREAKA